MVAIHRLLPSDQAILNLKNCFKELENWVYNILHNQQGHQPQQHQHPHNVDQPFSFWLNAPAKAFDPGTTRSLVETEGAEPALLVRYASGGVTPGDAYLWQLDENGVPLSWKMWISIIPIGGLEISWEGWTSLKTGARISTRHQAGPFTVEVEGVSGGNSLQDIGLSQNPFRLLD